MLYNESFKLAKPFRRIGRMRIEVDYRPTVLGHGLWIIEAKAHGAEDWEDAISQAWLYATHPEVDVPFMAVCDGSRITVYDVYKPDWNEPVVEIPTEQLAERFQDLAVVLGAANVTRAVRERRMRHLGDAMRAELSPARLNEYVQEVQRLAHDAMKDVRDNEIAVIRDQTKREDEGRRDLVGVAGLFAVGVFTNQPFALNLDRRDSALSTYEVSSPRNEGPSSRDYRMRPCIVVGRTEASIRGCSGCFVSQRSRFISCCSMTTDAVLVRSSSQSKRSATTC